MFFWTSCIPRSLDFVCLGRSCQSSRFTLGTHKNLQFCEVLYLSCNSLNFDSNRFLEHASFTRWAITSATAEPKLSFSSKTEGKNTLESSCFVLSAPEVDTEVCSVEITAVRSKTASWEKTESTVSDLAAVFLPWSQRLSFILYWQILRRELLLKFFLLARSAESREKKASGRDRWEPHFHAISFWPSILIEGHF